MNPEFERNLWLELTAGRMIALAAALALVFFASALMFGAAAGPAAAARWAYYVVVVIWGSRNAALGVVGEIRARTWDAQRLSSLGAGTMTWGKLFGATIYNWFGGAICLAVILASLADGYGLVVAAIELVYFVAVGAIAQSASLLASLIAARRRQGGTQFEVFLYQGAGIAAAAAAYVVWSIADPAGAAVSRFASANVVVWWGMALDARLFLLVSLAVFAGWILIGCYRQMRLELKMRNGPFVWLAFLAFMGLYTAGFDALLSTSAHFQYFAVIGKRLLLAFAAFWALSYAMVFLEPKSAMRYRWLAAEIAHMRVDTVGANLQAWMMSYLAAVAIGLLLLIQFAGAVQFREEALLVATLGFFTRDMAIVVAASAAAKRGGGDFVALAILILLYALLPAIFGGLQFLGGIAVFAPRPTDPLWLSPLAGWVEAVLLWLLAGANLSLKREAAKAA